MTRLNYEERLRRFQEGQAPRKAREAKRAKEQQEKENRQLMAKGHRKEVVKRLKEQITITTDPQQLIELANAIAKLTPRPKQIRRAPRKPAEEPKRERASFLPTGVMFDHLSVKERLLHYVVIQIEKKQKELRRKLTETESVALWEETVNSLPKREREELETLEPWKDGEVANV